MSLKKDKSEKKSSMKIGPTEPAMPTRPLNAIKSALQDMEVPIRESRRVLPTASRQLGIISTKTEVAANQMLEKIEQIIDHQDKIGRLSGELAGLAGKSQTPNVNDLIEMAERLTDMALTSKNDAFLIIDALQFQDTTSQQMEHASELLNFVEQRINHLQSIIFDSGMSHNNEPVNQVPDTETERRLLESNDQREVDDIISGIIDRQH